MLLFFIFYLCPETSTVLSSKVQIIPFYEICLRFSKSQHSNRIGLQQIHFFSSEIFGAIFERFQWIHNESGFKQHLFWEAGWHIWSYQEEKQIPRLSFFTRWLKAATMEDTPMADLSNLLVQMESIGRTGVCRQWVGSIVIKTQGIGEWIWSLITKHKSPTYRNQVPIKEAVPGVWPPCLPNPPTRSFSNDEKTGKERKLR